MRKELKEAVTKSMTAVIYARFSSSGQKEISIEGQVRENREYAKKYGLTVVGEYIDRAKSATTDNRPDFQRMIADAKKKKFKFIICWKTDRFARNRYDAAVYKKELKKSGVKVLYAKEDIPDNALGVLQLGILETLDEYYSASLSENVKRGYYDSALKHKYLGTRSLGYVKSKDGLYEIDPAEAEIVKRIFNEYAKGRYVYEIINDLNRDGYRTAMGKEFTRSSLKTILRNEHYIGVYTLGDVYREEDVIPPIIQKDQFEKVQKLLKQKKRVRCAKVDDANYILTTKLFCGMCGEPMTGESAKGRTGMYYYYTCSGKKKGSCKKKRENKEEIEQAVIQFVTEQLCNDEYVNKTIDDFMKYQEREDTELIALNATLSDTRKRISNLLKAMEEGIITPTTKDRLTALEERQRQTEEAIASHETKTIPREIVEFFFQQIRSGNKKDSRFQQKLIDLFVDKVYVYDDSLVIVYRMGDKTRSITYEEFRAVGVSAHGNAHGRTIFYEVWLIAAYQKTPR